MMARHASLFLCLAVAALLTLGLVMLVSTGAWVRNVPEPYHFFSRQAVMAGIGTVIAVGCCFLDVKWLRKFWPMMVVGACVLLGMCFLPVVGRPELGSARWIQLPLLGKFQPSEFAKVVCAIALAGWFSRWQTETRSFWRGFVLPGMIVGSVILLVAVETDVGSALAMSVTVAAVMFCMGTRLLYLIPTALVAMSGAGYYLYHNENRWLRILAWQHLDDPVNQRGTGMQQYRALLAFGNGGPTGVGLGNGSEKFGTLTFAHIDFIFPMVGEELGLFGTLGAVLCYVIIAIAGSIIAAQASTTFDRALAYGLTIVIVLPAMQNIAVVTAMLPNDGLPLPFVSFGGTSLIGMLIAVGLLCGVHRRSRGEIRKQTTLPGQALLEVKL